MFRLGARQFSTSVRRMAESIAQMEGPNPYGIKVSTVQGYVKGLTGGWSWSLLMKHKLIFFSHWQYPTDPIEQAL